MTRTRHLPLLLLLLAAFGPVTARGDELIAPVAGHDGAVKVTRHDTPAPVEQSARPGSRQDPNGVIVSPWTRLGPSEQPGPTRRATLANSGFDLAIGSDQAGFFVGYPFADSFWDARGDELDSGVHHIATGYYNPALGARPQVEPAHGPGIQGFYERVVVSTDSGRIRWSPDSGYTWYTPLGLDPNIDRCVRLLKDGLYSNVVYLLAHASDSLLSYPYFKVYVSYDVGESWNETHYFGSVDPYDTIDMFVRRDPVSEIYLIQGYDGDVNVSTDNTWSWTSVGQASPGGLGGWRLTGIEVDTALYAMDADGEIFRSLDWGFTWNPHAYANANGTGDFCGAVYSSGVLLEGGARAAGWGEGCWWSEDGGATWTAFDSNDWIWDPTDLCPDVLGIDCLLPAYFPAGQAVPGGRPGVNGISVAERFYIHTAGGTYIWYYNPMAPAVPELMSRTNFVNNQYYDMLSRYVDPLTYGLELGSRGRAQQGANGTPLLYGYPHVSSSAGDDVGTVTASQALSPQDPYVWSVFGGFLVVIVGPGEFAATGDPADPIAKPLHPFMMADPDNPFDLIWGGAELWRLRYDPGTDSFTPTSLAGGFSSDFYERVAGVGISPADHNYWYLCTSYGRIFTSTDNGATWTFQSAAGPQTNDAVWQKLPVVPDPIDRMACVMGGEGGVVLGTTDGGITWAPVGAGLPFGTRVWDLAYDNATDRNLYAATEDGPMQLVAGTWNDLAPAYNADGIPEVPFRTVHSVPWQGVMRWGTLGRGVYDLTIGSASAVRDPGTGAGSSLLAVRPAENPMRGAGVVDVQLPEGGRVRLDLFDPQGRRVRALYDGVRAAGDGRIELDLDGSGADRLPDGVYFLRLATERQATSTRIVVARN